MGEKDITEKTLESYPDVFADIMNVLLFHGKQVVNKSDLEDTILRSHYKADNSKLHEMERDTAKYWKNSNIRIAFIGYENQTQSDPDAPLRAFGYDGAGYRNQMLADIEEIVNETTGERKKLKKRKPRYPIITLFLYFGYKQHWNKPLQLHECLNIPEGLKPYVNDYKINLFEIAYLSEEQVNLFQSDFRIVADYFVQMRKNNDYIPSPEHIQHVHEVLELMSVMTKDRRFEETYYELTGGVNVSMCEVLDKIEAKGRAIGKAEGRAIGKAEGRAIGEAEGISLIITLNNILLDAGRIEDLKKASKDEAYRNQLIKELLPNQK